MSKYSILPLSGTLRGPRNSVPLSECPTYPKIHISGTSVKKYENVPVIEIS